MGQRKIGWTVAVLILACLPLLARAFAQPTAAETLGAQQGYVTLLDVAPSETPTESAYPLPTATCPPPATSEPLWVDPVTSPTGRYYQVIKVYLGRGREVTVTGPAGTGTARGIFDSYSKPAYVAVPLVPNSLNPLTVTGKVEYHPGCYYTISVQVDRNGDPLVIEHRDDEFDWLFLPLVLEDEHVTR